MTAKEKWIFNSYSTGNSTIDPCRFKERNNDCWIKNAWVASSTTSQNSARLMEKQARHGGKKRERKRQKRKGE